MSRYSTRKPAVTKEQQVAKKVARALTEDFNSDLEGVGYSISADHAPIRNLNVVWFFILFTIRSDPTQLIDTAQDLFFQS